MPVSVVVPLLASVLCLCPLVCLRDFAFLPISVVPASVVVSVSSIVPTTAVEPVFVVPTSAVVLVSVVIPTVLPVPFLYLFYLCLLCLPLPSCLPPLSRLSLLLFLDCVVSTYMLCC